MKSYTEHIIDVCTNRNCTECKNYDNDCFYCGFSENWEPNYKKVIETAWKNYLYERYAGGNKNDSNI